MAASKSKYPIARMLKPYWLGFLGAFVAVVFGSLADVLEPWPIKIVLDYVIGSKQSPGWLATLSGIAPGTDTQAVLNFAVIAVVTIAIIGAVTSYTEDYLSTKVGQWIMH